MIMYCYVMECYVGEMVFEGDQISMHWEPDDSKLTPLALKYKKFINLSSTEAIKRFIDERCIDPARPDRGIWLGRIGLHCNASNLEIFLKGHGVSINDYFWISEEKSPKFWYEKLSPDYR